MLHSDEKKRTFCIKIMLGHKSDGIYAPKEAL